MSSLKKRLLRTDRLAVLVIALLIVVLAVIPWWTQNRRVRDHFNGLFQAMQDQDGKRVNRYYAPTNLSEDYLRQLFKYPLLGWKITKVVGQPFPLEGMQEYRGIAADMYFDLPEAVRKRHGYKEYTHPAYGRCAVVPVAAEYIYIAKDRRFLLVEPDYASGANWTAPFEGRPAASSAAKQAPPGP